MNVRDRLQARIDASNDKIKELAANGPSLSQSRAAQAELRKMTQKALAPDTTPEEIEEIRPHMLELADHVMLANEVDTVNRLQETVAQFDRDEIVVIDARYVIIDQDDELISPAGFLPEEGVFLKTSYMVGTDNPNWRPKMAGTFQKFDLRNLR